MNDLNSLLIEGVAKEIKQYEVCYLFKLHTHRVYAINDEIKSDDSIFEVVVPKTKIRNEKFMEENARVRIVGRIHSNNIDNSFEILAEHIEWKES